MIFKNVLFLLSMMIFFPLFPAIDMSQYALPQGSMRTKLDEIFKENKEINQVETDGSWTDFKSWHWIIGKLTTLGNTTNFVVKGQKYKLGTKIQHPLNPVLVQEHADTQNLSRIIVAKEADKVIKAHNLDRIRTVKSWVYPISGNDADLKNATDATVIVVEEMVKPSNSPRSQVGNDLKVQKSILRMDTKTYEQLVKVATEANILDLHPGNLIEDENGKIVLIDVENLMLRHEQEVNKSSIFLRWLKRYKLNKIRAASAKTAVAMTALPKDLLDHMQQRQNPAIEHRGRQLLAQAKHDVLVKRFYFEYAGLAGAAVVALRHLYHQAQVDYSVNEICKIQRIALSDADGMVTDERYLEVAQAAIGRVLPKEKRPDFIKAVATYAKAETAIRHYQTGHMNAFGNEYFSAYEAKAKSQAAMVAILTLDWSLSANAVHLVKGAWNRAIGLFEHNQEVADEQAAAA